MTDGSIEAEYQDGYIHNEDKYGDISPYDSTKNIFNDVLEHRPEAEHGKMVRFSVFAAGQMHSIKWANLSDNARPIRFKHMQRDHNLEGTPINDAYIVKIDFGYQYTDENGKNVQEITEII